MISCHAEGSSGCYRVHDESNHAGRIRSAIHKIAYKYDFSSVGMTDAVVPGLIAYGITEAREQLERLIEATVDVADDVERPGLGLLVVPEKLPANRQSNQLLRRVEDADMPEPLTLETTQGFP